VSAQLRAIEQEFGARQAPTGPGGVCSLMLLSGEGWVGAWVLVMKRFVWREWSTTSNWRVWPGESHKKVGRRRAGKPALEPMAASAPCPTAMDRWARFAW